jgi:hypothetical protein
MKPFFDLRYRYVEAAPFQGNPKAGEIRELPLKVVKGASKEW